MYGKWNLIITIFTMEGTQEQYFIFIASFVYTFFFSLKGEPCYVPNTFPSLSSLTQKITMIDSIVCLTEYVVKLVKKEYVAELLKLAREELVKQGYVIEKKAFHDAVEKIDDKYKAEMSVQYSLHCKVENGTRHAVMNWNEFQKVAQHFFDCGKAEALKDLPRWEDSQYEMDTPCVNLEWLHVGKNMIYLPDLEKLPKED